jgi:hypothetical protein
MQCAAKSKRTGQQCGAQAITGMRVCYFHGGASARGISSGTFKHGRRSKYMPQQMRARYLQALRDPDLRELDQDLALVETRLTDLIAKVQSNGNTGAMLQVWQKYQALRGALAKGKDGEQSARECFALLEKSIEEGLEESKVWQEIVALIEQRRKLLDSAMDHQVKREQMIPVDEAVNWGTGLMLAIREIVKDRRILTEVQRVWDQLSTIRPQKVIEAEVIEKTPPQLE